MRGALENLPDHMRATITSRELEGLQNVFRAREIIASCDTVRSLDAPGAAVAKTLKERRHTLII